MPQQSTQPPHVSSIALAHKFSSAGRSMMVIPTGAQGHLRAPRWGYRDTLPKSYICHRIYKLHLKFQLHRKFLLSFNVASKCLFFFSFHFLSLLDPMKAMRGEKPKPNQSNRGLEAVLNLLGGQSSLISTSRPLVASVHLCFIWVLSYMVKNSRFICFPLMFCSKENYEGYLWLGGSRKWPFGRCKKPTETLTHQTCFQFAWLPVSSCSSLFFSPLQTSSNHLFQVSCFTHSPSIPLFYKALKLLF